MRVDVLTEVLIDRPLDVVASYAADQSTAPEWYDNIESVEWQTEPPARVGSVVAFVASFLGRRLEYAYEIVELDANERLAMRTRQGPFPMETTYTWEAHGAGRTCMTLRNRGEPSGFSLLVAPVMRQAIRRANNKDLARLKRILERGDREAFIVAFTSGWAMGKGIEAFLDHFDDRWVDPDVVLHQPLLRPVRGRAAFDSAFRRLFAAMPDLDATVRSSHPTPVGVQITLLFRGTLGRTPVEFHSIDDIELRRGRLLRRSARVTLRPLLSAAFTDRAAGAALWKLVRPGRRR